MSSEPSETQDQQSTDANSTNGQPTQEVDQQQQPATNSPDAATDAQPPPPADQSSSSGAIAAAQRKLLIGSQRDPANRKLAPSKPKAVRQAAETPAVKDESHAETATAATAEPDAPQTAPAADSPNGPGGDSPESSSSPDAATSPPHATDIDTGEVHQTAEAGGAPQAEPGDSREGSDALDSSEADDQLISEAEAIAPAVETDDLEKEINDALGQVSIEELMSEKDVEATSVEVEIDARYKATVTKIHGDNVFYTLRGHHQGVASAKQFKHLPKIGAQMDVVVTGFHADDGLYELHIPGASVSVSDWADLAEGALVEAKVTGANTGGLECLVGNIRGFIPASQIEIYRVDNLSDYINQKLQCVVTEANPRRRNLVLSHRAVAERQREEDRQEFLETLEVGQQCEGTVTKLMDFGAFVNIGGGVDGLVHISKMSWDRIDHPKEVFEVGQQVNVKVEKVDKQTGKIGLSYRDTQSHPWEDVQRKYPEGAVVQGKVSKVARFGAFVRLEAGVEGLIHISELAHHRVFAVSNIVQEGEDVEVKVLSVDADNQRIGLSLKATQAAPVKEEKKENAAEADDGPPRELAVPKHKGPLKGGKDKPSGGEQFGLNW